MKLLFAGASGYGNVGDDAYRLAYQRDLGDEHVLRFDSPYPDVDAVTWADAVIIGGGGLIYCNDSAHFDYMRRYMQAALDQKKPLMFSSCGVQLTSGDLSPEAAFTRGIQQIAPWKTYLEAARFVSVRGAMDAKILKAVAPKARIEHFPDLCYSLKSTPRFRLIPEGSIVLIPTTNTAPKGFNYGALKKRATEAGRDFRVVLFSWVDQPAARTLETSLHLRRGLHLLENASVEDVLHSILPYAAVVVSARYHGHVLATAAGVPEVSNIDRRFKSHFEPAWPSPTTDALGHTALLRHALKAG